MKDAELRGLFEKFSRELRQDLRQEIVQSAQSVREDLRQEIVQSAQSVREDLRQEIAQSAQSVREDLRQEIAQSAQSVREDLRNEMAKMRHEMILRFEHLESRFDLTAEALVMLNEKIGREATDIRSEMRQGFADTHDLIRFAYRDLDSRHS